MRGELCAHVFVRVGEGEIHDLYLPDFSDFVVFVQGDFPFLRLDQELTVGQNGPRRPLLQRLLRKRPSGSGGTESLAFAPAFLLQHSKSPIGRPDVQEDRRHKRLFFGFWRRLSREDICEGRSRSGT